jgi:FemAB-related protein (PEP-CTERM system-associated)
MSTQIVMERLRMAAPDVVRRAAATDDKRWDDFVGAHAHGSPFHMTAWRRVIEKSFGFRPYYLMAASEDGVTGVLPLFLVRNPLIKKALISSPFAVYGGILAETEAARTALAAAARQLGEELGVQYIELRNAHEGQCSGFERVSRYVTFTQEIGSQEEAILASIPRKTRYMVRKTLKESFTTRREVENIANFEELYSRNLRKLGTPSFPRRFFELLMQEFSGMADIRETLYEEKLASAVLSFYFRDQVLPYYGASDPSFNALAPNNFMYYDLMRWGGQNGYRLFDFGRSKKVGSGSYEFKAHWGMVERELPYEVLLVRAKEVPNYSPNNPRYAAVIKAWQRLPLAFTRRMGPYLIRLTP